MDIMLEIYIRAIKHKIGDYRDLHIYYTYLLYMYIYYILDKHLLEIYIKSI